MDVNIDDIIANHVYYLHELNIGQDEECPYADLSQLKLLSEQANEISNNLEETASKPPLNKMFTLVTNFAYIVKKRKLSKICDRLVGLKMEKRVTDFELNLRLNDLFIDTDEFYQYSDRGILENVTSIRCFLDQENPSINYNYVIRNCSIQIQYIVEMMNDLNERLSVLMHLMDPSSTKMLTSRTSPHMQANLIAKRSESISYRFKVDIAVREELKDICRLNRRMYVVASEAVFAKFSERDERRYNIIKRLSKFHAVLPEEDKKYYNFVEIVELVETLRKDIVEQNGEWLQTYIKYDYLFTRLYQSEDYSYYKPINIVTSEITNEFKKMSAMYKSFQDQFLAIITKMEDAWNNKDLLDLDSSENLKNDV